MSYKTRRTFTPEEYELRQQRIQNYIDTRGEDIYNNPRSHRVHSGSKIGFKAPTDQPGDIDFLLKFYDKPPTQADAVRIGRGVAESIGEQVLQDLPRTKKQGRSTRGIAEGAPFKSNYKAQKDEGLDAIMKTLGFKLPKLGEWYPERYVSGSVYETAKSHFSDPNTWYNAMLMAAFPDPFTYEDTY